MAMAFRSPAVYWFAMLRSVNRTPGGGEKIVPSETRESLYGRFGVSGEGISAGGNNVLPASEEKIFRVLSIGGQLLEEIGIGFRDVVAEIGVSLLEGEQLRVIVSGVGQGTKGVVAMIISGQGGSGGRRVKGPKGREKYKRFIEHDAECRWVATKT